MRYPRTLTALGVVASVLTGTDAAAARSFTVDDLLSLQAFGQVLIDPTSRWAVFERTDRYDSAPAYDGDQAIPELVTRLRRVDLRTGRVRPLLAGDPRGVTAGAFSPDGNHLVVIRRHGHRRQLGVAAVASGEIRWLPVTPSWSLNGRAWQWRSGHKLLALAQPPGGDAGPGRNGWGAPTRYPARWRAAAAGASATTVIGSGVYRGLRPRTPDQRLVAIDVDTSRARSLATGAFEDLEISPDGRRVAIMVAGADLQPHPQAPAQGAWGVQTRAHSLRLVDLVSGQVRLSSTALDILPTLLTWSPDSQALLAFGRPQGTPWTAGTPLRVERDGTVRALPIPGLAPEIVLRPETLRTAWVGGTPLLLASGQNTARLDWYALTPNGPRNLTSGFAPTAADPIETGPSGATVASADGAWRIAPDRPAQRVGRAQPRLRAVRSAPRRVWPLLASVPLPGWLQASAAGRTMDLEVLAPNGQAAIAEEASGTGQARLLLLRPDAPPVTLSTINERLADVDAPRVIAIPHAGAGGRLLTSWLFLPPPSGRPPPLVVKVYPGDVNDQPPAYPPPVLGLVLDVRSLVGHGYAVLVPSLPLAHDGTDPTADLATNVLEVVDALAARRDLAGAYDPGRLGLVGHSYGGYGVMAILTQTNRFRAAVEDAGASDLISMAGTFQVAQRAVPEAEALISWSQGWVESAQGAMGAPPWVAMDSYVRNSPALHADRITTPLLLVHGDLDTIPVTQAEEMFSALYRQDKDAVFVTYWGQTHYVASPGAVRDLYGRMFSFLDALLSGQPSGPTSGS